MFIYLNADSRKCFYLCIGNSPAQLNFYNMSDFVYVVCSCSDGCQVLICIYDSLDKAKDSIRDLWSRSYSDLVIFRKKVF